MPVSLRIFVTTFVITLAAGFVSTFGIPVLGMIALISLAVHVAAFFSFILYLVWTERHY